MDGCLLAVYPEINLIWTRLIRMSFHRLKNPEIPEKFIHLKCDLPGVFHGIDGVNIKKRTMLSDLLTPWRMEPRSSMPHSQGLSNNPYPEPNQANYPH